MKFLHLRLILPFLLLLAFGWVLLNLTGAGFKIDKFFRENFLSKNNEEILLASFQFPGSEGFYANGLIADGVVWSVDGATGKILSSFDLATQQEKKITLSHGPAIICATSREFLIVTSMNSSMARQIYLLDSKDGAIKWQIEDKDFNCSGAIISDNEVLSINSSSLSSTIYSILERIDLRDGSVKKIDLGNNRVPILRGGLGSVSNVVSVNGNKYFMVENWEVKERSQKYIEQSVIGLDPSGKVILDRPGAYSSQIVAKDNVIYYNEQFGEQHEEEYLIAFDVQSNKELWRQKSNGRTRFLAIQGNYIIQGDNRISSRSLTNGTVSWSRSIINIINNPFITNAIVVGDKIGIVYTVVEVPGMYPKMSYNFELMNDQGKTLYTLVGFAKDPEPNILLTSEKNNLYLAGKGNKVYKF